MHGLATSGCPAVAWSYRIGCSVLHAAVLISSIHFQDFINLVMSGKKSLIHPSTSLSLDVH